MSSYSELCLHFLFCLSCRAPGRLWGGTHWNEWSTIYRECLQGELRSLYFMITYISHLSIYSSEENNGAMKHFFLLTFTGTLFIKMPWRAALFKINFNMVHSFVSSACGFEEVVAWNGSKRLLSSQPVSYDYSYENLATKMKLKFHFHSVIYYNIHPVFNNIAFEK